MFDGGSRAADRRLEGGGQRHPTELLRGSARRDRPSWRQCGVANVVVRAARGTTAAVALGTVGLFPCSQAAAECPSRCSREQVQTRLIHRPEWTPGAPGHSLSASPPESPYRPSPALASETGPPFSELTAPWPAANSSEQHEEPGPLLDPREDAFGVQHEITVHLIFWGENFRTTSVGREVQQAIEALFTHLSGSAYQGLLTQYFDAESRISPRVNVIPYNDEREHRPAPEDVGYARVREEAESAARANGWPAERSAQFMVITPPGATWEPEFTTHVSCGYHTYTYPSGGPPLVFSFVPYQGDAAQAVCATQEGLHQNEIAKTDEAAAHEYAEAATDPVGDGWTAANGRRADELADICNSGPPVAVAGYWVAPLYDEHTDSCAVEDASPPDLYAITGSPSCATSTSAVLSGTVNAEEPETKDTVYYFQYGPTTEYRSTTEPKVATTRVDTEINQPVSALQPETTYHYRLVATTTTLATGRRETTYGKDETFTTGSASATAPVVLGVSPARGSENQVTSVTLTGTDLSSATAVDFGNASAKSFSVQSATSISAQAPVPGTGSVDITVTTPAGSSTACAADRFAYVPAPAITSVEPSSGPLVGGTRVTINGTHLGNASAVAFGGTPAAVTNDTGVSITAVSPAVVAPGPVSVTVITPGGTSGQTQNDIFTYVARRPTITEVAPDRGPEGGGTPVTLRGEDFEDVTAVYFGLVKLTSGQFSVNAGGTEITATPPAGSGTVNVGVQNPGGTSAVVPADRYTYVLGSVPAPTVEAVQPNAGPLPGGTPIIISGKNLTGTTKVRVGDSAATNVVVDSPTMVSAVTPDGNTADEALNVNVEAPNGTGQKEAVFTYRRVGAPLGWGRNSWGQLGEGTTSRRSEPVQAAGGGEALQVAGGEGFTLALMKGGAIEAYGSNAYGELGDQSNTERRTPVAVALTGASAIAAGVRSGYALKEGHVYAWGDNESGELGSGGTRSSNTPEEVSQLTEVVAIAAGKSESASTLAGGEFAMALRANGTVEAWGSNESGQLGDGTTEDSEVPVEVTGLREVVAIAAGHGFALALLRNGTVAAWGAGVDGQLGDGGTGNSSKVPVPVSELSGATAIAAGGSHALALEQDGAVEAWGLDVYGQLGDGKVTEAMRPEPVVLSSAATAIAAGEFSSAALLANGMVDGWGKNDFGELGDGTTSGPEQCLFAACSERPVPTSDISDVASIGTGARHTLATGLMPPVVTGLSPGSGNEFGGTSVTISGVNLQGATEVRFGEAKGTIDSIGPSGDSITATSPAGTGIVDVTVVSPHGTSTANSASQFSYVMGKPSEGFSFSSPVEKGRDVVVSLPQEGGFSFGPLKVTGSAGETAKIEVTTPAPAYEETEPGEYRSTGRGVQVSVQGFRSQEHKIGPLDVACTVPETIVLAEIPIGSSTGESRPYSVNYSASCMFGPGVANEAGTAQITMTGSAPSAVTPGQRVEVTNASFKILVPKNWTEALVALGGNEANGTSTASATAIIVG